MVAAAGVWKKNATIEKPEELAIRDVRQRILKIFHLAREIKEIDDEIAEYTQHVEQERRTEQRAASPPASSSQHPSRV